MDAYVDLFESSLSPDSAMGELVFESEAGAGEWIAESGDWHGEAGEGSLEWAGSSPSGFESENLPPGDEAIPVAAIIPVLTQLAPVLLQAAPAIIGAVQAAMPAMQGLLRSFTQGAAPPAVARGREMASEAAVLEATLAAMENVLAQVEPGYGSSESNRLAEPPESRFRPVDASEFLPALAGIVAALAPVVGQVISSITSRKRSAPPSRSQPQPVIAAAPVAPGPVLPAPAIPMSPPSMPASAPSIPTPHPAGGAVGGAGQAIAMLAQLMPLLGQLATQLAGPPATNPTQEPPAPQPA